MDSLPSEPSFMSGTQAIARGAWESSVNVVTSYPGSPVTGIVNEAAQYDDVICQWASNEKSALEIAAGISHCGGRALVVMKHVGLNVAADPFFNLAYTGVEGGLVIIVGDDPGAKSSQNEQDSRQIALAANVPVLEPANNQEAYLYTKIAFSISEKFDLPVLVRVTDQHCYSHSSIVTGTRLQHARNLSFAQPIQKYLLLPDFVVNRHKELNNNIKRLTESDWIQWLSECNVSIPSSGVKHDFGIICAGYSYSLIKDAIAGERIPILKLGMAFPIDYRSVIKFARECKKVLVIESSSRTIEYQVRQYGVDPLHRTHFEGIDEVRLSDLMCDQLPKWNALLKSRTEKKNQPEIDAPVALIEAVNETSLPTHISLSKRPAGFCAGCSHSPIFHQLSERNLYVVGDIGCYTLGATEPFSSLHANLCMGASIGILQGYLTVMEPEARKKAVAVIGDSTFFHSGIPPLVSAVNAASQATVLILDNSRSAMTGYQETYKSYSADQWRDLLKGLRIPEFDVVNALDLSEISSTLDRHIGSEQLSVMVVKGDCVQGMPTKEPTNYRYTINNDLCTACGKCQETDCPSIINSSTQGRDIFEITNECIGCGFCSQTCPEKAILPISVSFESKAITKALSKIPWHRVIRSLRATPVVKDVLEKFERTLY